MENYKFTGAVNCDKCKFFPDCKVGEANCPYMAGWQDGQAKLLAGITAPVSPKGGSGR
jgi:hypothetical protein